MYINIIMLIIIIPGFFPGRELTGNFLAGNSSRPLEFFWNPGKTREAGKPGKYFMICSSEVQIINENIRNPKENFQFKNENFPKNK